MNISPSLILATAAALVLGACKSTGGDPNAFDTSSVDGPGINVTSAEKQFGLDYSFDAETGQMTRDNSHEFQKSQYNPGAGAFKTSEYVNRLNAYEPGKFNSRKSFDARQADKRGTFDTFTSRLANRDSREAGSAFDTASDPLANSSRNYSTSPYRKSAQRMQSGSYRPAADAQTTDNRPPKNLTREQRPGDPGVVINKRGSDVPTVEDIADLLKKD